MSEINYGKKCTLLVILCFYLCKTKSRYIIFSSVLTAPWHNVWGCRILCLSFHLLCLRMRSCSHMLKGKQDRERDQGEGAGMGQDCFGFGAIAAVSDVRWGDVIIWPWRTTMVSHQLPHCNNTPVHARLVFLWICIVVYMCIWTKQEQQQRSSSKRWEKRGD